MATPAVTTDRAAHAPADEPTVAASLQALNDRIQSMAEVIDALRTFPFDQRQERFSMYTLKAYILPRIYWHGMLRGRM